MADVQKNGDANASNSSLSPRRLLIQIRNSRIFNPKNWSLRLRFLTVPALLLGLGCLTLAFIFHRYQNLVVVESVESRLSVFDHWVQDKIATELDVLLSEVTPLASMPEIVQSMADRDRDRLVRFILPYVERLRATTGRDSLYFHFHLPPATSFLRTWDVEATGADLTGARPMVVKANKYRAAFKGLEVGPGGAAMRAIVPLFQGGDHLGSVEAATSLENLLQSISLPANFGVLLLIDKRFENILGQNRIRAVHGKWIIGRSINIPNEKQLLEALDANNLPAHLGKVYYRLLPLEDFEGRSIGGILLAYDSAPLVKSSFNESLAFALFFTVGAMILWFHIYLNVVRVKKFLTRLGRVLTNTIAGDFTGHFDTEPIHCLEILHCEKRECPVYHDPMRICYLETGSEALSIKDRNTCCFLAKYKHCRFCPVYSRRRGDELVEMRHTVNTLVRLWGLFMGRVGQVVSGVLQTPGMPETSPSLGQISTSLEHMAGITAFSHDIQGVYNKWEVYGILGDALERNLDLREFAILEMDAASQSMIVASDKIRKPDVLCAEMFGNPELCRAKRLAEAVHSAPNAALCPFFHVSDDSHVRCCLPIVMGGHVGGVMTFLIPRQAFAAKRLALSIVQKYLMVCAPVLASLGLLEMTKEQSLRDPLTGVNNRRFLENYMRQYEEVAKRSRKTVGFLMVDVDYFKQVNDQYGHLAGDAVLKDLAALLKRSVRAADMVIRFGGEEFLVLLHEVQKGLIQEVGEKIRRAVEEHTFILPGEVALKKTVSVGTAEYPEDAASFYKAIKFADVALYQAKQGGRNQVRRFSPDMWTDEKY